MMSGLPDCSGIVSITPCMPEERSCTNQPIIAKISDCSAFPVEADFEQWGGFKRKARGSGSGRIAKSHLVTLSGAKGL